MKRVASFFRDFSRLWLIALRLLPVIFSLRYTNQREIDPAAPDRFVQSLLFLGPAFVKLGQVLSTRPDLLPREYTERLAELQENAPRIDFSIIRRIVEDELGKSIETCFEIFDPAPVAAASLAQVHRARLSSGEWVAVKVQRPRIETFIRRDLDALFLGLRIASWIIPARMRRTNLTAFLTEFRRYSMKELDFGNEAVIMDRFRANFDGTSGVHIPRTWSELSTKKVLVMEWVEGMRLAEAAATLEEAARSQLVDRLLSMLLKMFITDGLFHADLHPGNVFFHRDGTTSLLDFGMYGELSPVEKDRFLLYWQAVGQHQTKRAFHHFISQTEALPEADRDAFQQRFEQLAETFYSAPSRNASLARTYLEMMRAGYRTGFVFPASLILHAKAMTTAEALLFDLAPEGHFDEMSRPFVAREMAKRLNSTNLIGRLSQILPEFLLLSELPPVSAMDRDWNRSATRDMAMEIFSAFLEKNNTGRDLLSSMIMPIAVRHFGEEASSLLADTWVHYDELEGELDVASNAGAVLTTHLAVLTLALFKALTQRGFSRPDAQSRIHDLAWDIYKLWGAVPLAMARTFTSNPRKRLKLATDAFRRFPFSPPSYGWRDVEAAADVVAFDCTACPVAAFFLSKGEGELCTATWCKLDFPLAEMWGGRLERPMTIAGGHSHCDFRWHTVPDLNIT